MSVEKPRIRASDSEGNAEPDATLGIKRGERDVVPGEAPPLEGHLRTDHLLTNLKGRAISGGIATTAAGVTRFALSMASIIVLARLLSPADFGLVAMVGALIGFLRVFKEGGLSMATVQKEDVNDAQISNLFWINIGLGALAGLTGAILAPAVAWFFRDSRLVGITVILSSSFLVSGATVQHLALLNRQMRFKIIGFIDVASGAIGLVVAVVMALSGCGYWSLVGSQLAMPVAEFLMASYASQWRPKAFKRRSGTRAMVRFGASLTTATLLRRIADSSDTFLIGRFYGADAVGLYSRAMALLLRPMDQFIFPFDVVVVPALSRMQEQPDRYRRTFLRVYGTIALLSVPMAGLLLGLAHPLVMILLGRQWEGVVPIFTSFAIAAMYIPLGYAAMWLLTTQGRTKDILTTGWIFSSISVVSFVAGLPFGPAGVALAFALLGLLIRLPIQYYVVGRRGPVSTADLWLVFLRYMPTWAAVVAGTFLGHLLLPDANAFAQVGVCAPLGILAGIAVVMSVPSQRREALGLADVMRSLIQRRRPACV